MLLSRIRMLRGRGRAGAGAGLIVPSLEELLRDTRQRLLDRARLVGLTGIHRLGKAAIAARVRQELERLATPAGAPEAADAPTKFDLGFTPGGPASQKTSPGATDRTGDRDGRRPRSDVRLLGGD